ncbi:DNA-directed RNA polymerase III subunit RPC6 [Galendromus occidentalis]|uniref:DNA-directed RNA polymerase III subunit RPC6 n=1 Tax=Galendromus occidentalis TaxID=34638 RepID=A0AAJ6QS39_9ACAR|nr:DNA-directed RNA polymerase III subunit RPC6 [Galendromus occidentalis]
MDSESNLKRIKLEPGGSDAGPAEVKEETLDPVSVHEIEDTIMKLCESQREGINDSVMQIAMPFVKPPQRAMAINKLLAKGKIEILKQGGKLLYRFVDQDKTRGCERDERVVFQVIERAGNKGIWIRDIRIFSGLVLAQLSKVLKSLEVKKLIKSVKSVSAAKKKVYMLYELEPDRSITGGAWYSGQDFESEFVDILQQQCLRFLVHKAKTASEKFQDDFINMRNNAVASTEDVWNFIKQLGISKVQLDVGDIEVILNTLHYQGKVVRSISSEKIGDSNDHLSLWASLDHSTTSMAICNIPCGKCMVRHDCSVSGVRRPSSCAYVKDLLKDIEDLELNSQEELSLSGPICDSLLDY